MKRFKKNKKILTTVVVAGLLSAVVYLAWPASNPPTKAQIVAPTPTSSKATTNSFDKNQYPTDEAASLWVVVNKGRALPSNYVPANLIAPNVPLRLSASSSEMHVRSDMATALQVMFAQAKSQGFSLKLASGYRSYTDQLAV